MRILVAEDERITRASLVRQLEGWGHAVTAAEDGEAAWERYSGAEFDLVITDWEMPRLSGVDLIRRIRTNPRPGYVYIIMLTGRKDKADIVSGIEAGADDFVSKPFDREELRARMLAGERVVRLERTLSTQNDELREAGARMRRDLEAAARVQRAMLPRKALRHAAVRTDFVYVPTDELAGDALGFHLVGDRHLVAYVIDVTGHGVPAALLAVTAMHALSPAAGGDSPLRPRGDPVGRPAGVVAALNRRFSAGDNDGRFLTMVLCILDTHDGRLRFARAGHPLPLIVRAGDTVTVGDEGGFPIGVVDDAEYEDVEVQLRPGDRVYLYSDGFLEQYDGDGKQQFGEDRLRAVLVAGDGEPAEAVVKGAVDALAEWAGARRFTDDVSLVALEWGGA